MVCQRIEAFALLIACLVAGLAAQAGAAGIAQVWAVNDGEKGKRALVYVDLLGRPTRARPIGADEEGVVVSASGMEARMEWTALSPRRFYGIARKYTDDRAALSAYCRGMGLAEDVE